MKRSYFFSQPSQPTPYNLATHLLAQGYLNVPPGQLNDRHFHLSDKQSQVLEYKHHLADLCAEYCPGVMPETHYIDDHNATHLVASLRSNQQAHAWILKPALLNNGDGIQLFKDYEQIQRHFASTDRIGGPHVLQEYIGQPHLLQGHKYTIRLFVVLSSQSGAWLYPEGYFNIAGVSYDEHDFSALPAHLTNEHLNVADHAQQIQIPSSQAPYFNHIYSSLMKIATAVCQAYKTAVPGFFHANSEARFGLFGFDYLLDQSLRPWLLEVNHGPCFPCHQDHILQKYLYNGLWQTMITDIIEPDLGLSSHLQATEPCWQRICSMSTIEYGL